MTDQAVMAYERSFRKLGGKPKLKGFRRKLTSIPLKFINKAPSGYRIEIFPFGSIRFHKQYIPSGKIKCGRFVKRSSGWYLCLFIDADREPIKRQANGHIGIDPGFTHLITTSDGQKAEHPRELQAMADRLAQAQRSKNKRLAARIQERIANQRKDRNHKLSLILVQQNDFIAFSKDNHKGIAKRFGKSVASSAHYQLRQMLAYKSRAGGTRYVEVDSRNSTKTCSACGALSGPTGYAGLKVRHWVCGCGAEHDRDINAAINTLIAGAGAAHEGYANAA
jgi:transposase